MVTQKAVQLVQKETLMADEMEPMERLMVVQSVQMGKRRAVRLGLTEHKHELSTVRNFSA